jgi:two-component sensor histidine kinase
MLSGLVGLHAASLDDGTSLPAGDVRLILHGVSNKLQAIAGLHRLLSKGSSTTINLAKYICEVAQHTVATLSTPEKTNLILDASSGFVPVEQAVAVGLLLEEALTNSLKYAHPTGVAGEIIVNCHTHEDDGFIVEIIDDGVGFPDQSPSDGSCGLRIMRALAANVGAELEFKSEMIGLTVRLVKSGSPTAAI